MKLYSALITLVLVMDPFGSIPVFLSLLGRVDPQRRRVVILREMLIALGVLVLFLLLGRYILAALHVSGPAVSIAGGVILLLIAIRMIFPSSAQEQEAARESEPVIVPLAVPLIAGPSAIATVTLLSTRYPGALGRWLAALAGAWMVSLVVLLFSDLLGRILGTRILKAIERLMGMILTTLAVQMLLSGLQEFLEGVAAG
jgi:multiple antibiotic resistance protein